MGVLSGVGRFFSLDVLDGQYRTKDPTKRLRWQTPEFYFYYVVFILVVPLMFKSVMDISSPSHPLYATYQHLLSDGLWPGRKVDNSDMQYASFRDQIPILIALTFLHPLLRYILRTLIPGRIHFDVVFGIVFLVVMHGTGALKLLLITCFTYSIAKIAQKSMLNPVLTWTTIIALYFLNEKYQGYKFAALHPALSILDEYSGVLDRWHIHFNITSLRLISFNLDYFWSLYQPSTKSKSADGASNEEPTERQRIETPARHEDYNFAALFAYTFYAPLYLAGPILTFNNYIAQCATMPTTITKKRTLAYGLRLLVCLATMEWVLHYIYVTAISKAGTSLVWDAMSPMQVAMAGYFNLHIIWLKLLIPWRWFRFWGMLDGIETTENMIRCMSNNYSALAFWRSWHRSFNRWITRYIYIPLARHGEMNHATKQKASGQNKIVWTVLNMLAVFTFVAIWHDISLTLLTWGWLVVLFLMPELLLTILCAPLKTKWYYRFVCAAGAVLNILSMMAANLVGFSVGVDGVQSMIAAMFGSVGGFLVLGLSCAALFVGVQIMFEVREDEAARGINLRC